ncbi:P1 family peptidase, partial [Steroidobacter sp.]|uniref:DmpA family aminopeptidase n=1 Tax=Steroidobacter sp. TaxID=1978227 RepID=UPI001A37E244
MASIEQQVSSVDVGGSSRAAECLSAARAGTGRASCRRNVRSSVRARSAMGTLLGCLFLALATSVHAERARDLGIPLEGTPGPLNAITDVAGVEVGHITLIRGEGALKRGEGPVRTGVTAVLPRGRASIKPVFAAWHAGNAAGEMTGTVWLEERGLIDGPIMITNTHSVGVVRDATIDWMVTQGWKSDWFAPVVAETYDGLLNDINGFHVKREHALQAIDSARPGPVTEGNVGGGTGMICSQFKGGIGTASRVIEQKSGRYTVGVLVQCNYGAQQRLRISGVSIGDAWGKRYLPCLMPALDTRKVGWAPPCEPIPPASEGPRGREGSIIVVVATDAPLLPHQLKRVAKRPALAIGRLGEVAQEGSGDIFVAFSTANEILDSEQTQVVSIDAFPSPELTSIF